MAQTPQQFFEKNMRWFALAFLLLFLFKSVQSCNRNMGTRVTEKQNKHLIDSLQKNITDLNDSIKTVNWKNKMLESQAESEKRKAEAVQSVAEKIKSNTTTTVNVRGAEIDTIKRK
jgi:predicted ribosome quality control (RQC) complex YloA/Tae2 family protein